MRPQHPHHQASPALLQRQRDLDGGTGRQGSTRRERTIEGRVRMARLDLRMAALAHTVRSSSSFPTGWPFAPMRAIRTSTALGVRATRLPSR